MKWIGITGGIATGKSTVTKIIQDLGGVVIDADVLAREVVAPGSFGLRALVQQFGLEIVGADGELNRSRLGQIIFQHQAKRVLLEKILHPLIQWRALQERLLLEKKGHGLAFYDAALIFEKEMSDKFDGVVLVVSSAAVQRRRLMERNKISETEAIKRINVQLPLDQKRQLAHFVIDNDGHLKHTEEQVKKLFQELKTK